ncbi:MAG: hypothetical protein ACXW3X_10270 [Rhodoplanes sp.]
MVVKTEIVRELGADQLLLPALIEDGLIANEQAKYYFALLQEARCRADAPLVAAPDLRSERLAARVEDASLDGVVGAAEHLPDGRYRIPRASMVLGALKAAIAAMIAPLAEDSGEAFRARLGLLAPPNAPDDVIDGALIDRITSADRQAGDSLHLLVMDVHKALNRLQAEIATETIGGAKAYAVGADDRALVEAFMAGIARTSPLKFDHPGLAATATTSDGRLIIQNDLGTTDAHVLVVAVEGLIARVTYTDIHPERLAFFRRLFKGFEIAWSAPEQHLTPRFETGGYALLVATCAAADRAALRRFLEFLGSRLVFLIDWNRARKRLRAFVGKEEAIGLLDWAAAHDVGHRGFLEIGGDRAIYEAMEFAAGGRLHFGDRLIDVLGRERTLTYLRSVLETSARGLLAGRSPSLIKDEIKVELRACFETAHQHLLTLGLRHACYLQEIAAAVYARLLAAADEAREAEPDRLPGSAGVWESQADAVLNEARTEARQARLAPAALEFLERADDAADALEEAAFLLTLVARHRCEAAVRVCVGLGELLDEDARAFVSCLECARHLDAAGPRVDLDDFLGGIDRLFQIEHLADARLREVSALALDGARDFRELHLATRLADVLENASDSLAHAAQLLRRYVLEEVMQR